MHSVSPGLIALIGSGETTRYGGQVFESLIKQYPRHSRIAVLETPAGFELNSPDVAGRVADYLRKRLGNYDPLVGVVPARRRDSPFSPDDPDIVKTLAHANLIFLGPGSPSYAIRQLRLSLAWELLQARLWRGASLVLASAAVIAASRYALPVYEIYKVGEDLHWLEGLDLFGAIGLRLALVTHWNNNDGGVDLDTSHCFMGKTRFDHLRTLLPGNVTVVGIEEQTALLIDLAHGRCEVRGAGAVHILKPDTIHSHQTKAVFPLSALGDLHFPRQPMRWSPLTEKILLESVPAQEAIEVPAQILEMAEQRAQARGQENWRAADRYREKLESLGWIIEDTTEGFQLKRKVDRD